MPTPQRIAIIGNAAGGKSTLARRLAASLDLPRLEIDHIQWLPGWEAAPPERVAAAEEEFLRSNATWIIDGFGPWACIERRFELAQAVVFVDLPIWMHYWHAAERQMDLVRGVAPTTPAGCNLLDATGPLFETIWRVHTEFRPRILVMLDQLPPAKVHHLTAPQARGALTKRWGVPADA
jgi:adenylate kinase family enzyme